MGKTVIIFGLSFFLLILDGTGKPIEQLSDLFFMEFVIGLDKHFKKGVDNIVDYIPLITWLPDEYSANLFRQVNSTYFESGVADISA